MIAVEGLTKRYGDVLALAGLDFTVERGEILGFLGPNGAGKTTTMRILTGYLPPSSGSVRIAGLDVLTDSLAARRAIGYLPETVPLYNEMAVEGYLDFMASVRGVANRRAAVGRVLEACEIGDVRRRIIGQLSKGYRQRVGLAQALVHDPQVLVLDEPTIGLDPRQILSVRQLIRSLGGERTVILSTHILPEVSQVCDRVMILHRGQVVAEDTTEGLRDRLEGGARIQLEVAHPAPDLVERLGALDGVSSVVPLGGNRYEVVGRPGHDARAAIAECAVGCDWGLLEMYSVRLSLEEIFIQLTTDDVVASAATLEQEPEGVAVGTSAGGAADGEGVD